MREACSGSGHVADGFQWWARNPQAQSMASRPAVKCPICGECNVPLDEGRFVLHARRELAEPARPSPIDNLFAVVEAAFKADGKDAAQKALMAAIAAPPCGSCIHWKPAVCIRRISDRTIFDGIQLCDASDMYGDFSCWRAKP